jgi:glycerate dehydrogenase
MRVITANLPGRSPKAGRVSVDELLQRADAITLHCPLNDNTRHLIGEAELAKMKPHAFIVNTARGGLIDEQALAAALRRGHLGGAATDVLVQEPPVDGSVLLAQDIPRLIVTPHTAWGSQEARQRIVGQMAENAAAFRSGKPLRRVA